MKWGVPVCDLSARRALARGSGGMPPLSQEKFWISGLLRSFLVYSWDEIAKARPPPLDPPLSLEPKCQANKVRADLGEGKVKGLVCNLCTAIVTSKCY